MRLTFVTAGSRGDVQPLVALARGAQLFGFDVRVAANALYEELIRRTGLEFIVLPGQSPKEVWSDESKASARAAKYGGGVRYVTTLKTILRRKGPYRQSLMDIVDACRGSDAVVYSHASVVAFHVAECLGVKSVAAYLYPSLPSTAYPALLTPRGIARSRYVNAATHFVVHQTFWMVDRPWVNRWRVDDLSLRALGIVPPFNYVLGRGGLNLHGFSPHMVTEPVDWPANSHITGYWFLDEGATWTPPEALDRFVAAGPPPVCVTFGSEIDARPEELYGTVFEALADAGARAVLVTGWANRERLPKSDRVFVVESVPYDWLFSRVACVVHHAGTGTVGEILRAGKPSVCVPVHGEQRYWADLLWSTGVAARPIPRATIAVGPLTEAIRHVTMSDAIADRAAKLGACIRSEDGIGVAVGLIEDFVTADIRL